MRNKENTVDYEVLDPALSNNSQIPKSNMSKLGSMPRLNNNELPRSSREDIIFTSQNNPNQNDALSRRKEELKRKRGGLLDMNSDLDLDLDYRVPPQARQFHQESQQPSNMVGFRSKYHQDLKREQLDAKMA